MGGDSNKAADQSMLNSHALRSACAALLCGAGMLAGPWAPVLTPVLAQERAQERLPWNNQPPPAYDSQPAPYQAPPLNQAQPYEAQPRALGPGGNSARRDDAYRPPARTEPSLGEQYGNRQPVPYQAGPDYSRQDYPRQDNPRQDYPRQEPGPGYGQPYEPPPAYANNGPPPYRDDRREGSFSMQEITHAGHGFFGSISQGLASVTEHAFKRQGRPNGYILGEDVGGAFVAGLRYGQGTLYTKDAGNHKVYWQGPSIGYDAGAEGSKVMVLVYNLRDPADIYHRYGGIDGSAYIIGGVGLTFQSHGDVVLAPIRSGIGLRLGANIGYLKYSRRPDWNPF